MTLPQVVGNAIPAAFLAASLGILMTAPPRYLVATAVCGFAGRVTRDLLLESHMGIGWATLFAACVVVLLGAAVIRRSAVPPVVMVNGLLPLGAAGVTFDMILGFMRIPNLQGAALSAATVALVSSSAKAFMTYLALAVGMYLGMTLLRVVDRDSSPEV